MSHDASEQEFSNILAALGERQLTPWERERLWELLEAEPTRIEVFREHCFLTSEIAALTDEDLAAASWQRPPRNILALPGSANVAGGAWHWQTIAAMAALLMLAIGAASWWGLRTDAPSPEQVAVVDETPTIAPAESAPAPLTEGPRRAQLSLDDPQDEAVALSGAAALANSRTPRGGLPEGAKAIPAKISFNHHVRPILSENCFYCHGPDPKQREADLRLDLAEAAVADLGGYAALVPGDLAKSEIWQRILSDDPDAMMPPPDSHRHLSEADREILKRWIEDGAEYQPHWAYLTPVRAALPPPAEGKAATNPIDAFLDARLAEEGLTVNPPADARTLLRRLHFDLIGLPPTLEDLSAFEKSYGADPAAAVNAVAESLLKNPHYGERMALAWLDAARYADSNGFQQDGNRHQWPWRDWVVAAYQNNMPFDTFTIAQLAGDLLPEPTRNQIIATGFNRNHMLNGEGGAIKEEQRINNVIDRVDTTATTWLALTMACAQCHTHKYDPITHAEYYQFFAFFNNIPESGGIDTRTGQGCAFGNGVTVQLAKPLLALETEEQTKKKAEVADAIRTATASVAKEQIDIDERRRTWEAGLSAADLADRSRFLENFANVLRTAEDKRNDTQKREVAEFYLTKGDHGKSEWKALGDHLVQLRKDSREVEESVVQMMVMEENKTDATRETFVLNRGDYQQPTDKVTAGTPAFLPPLDPSLPRNRLGLARWLTDPDHPLTARVAVNRLWAQFFGLGMVKTTEDFGVQGELPIHPELLDWLAREFVESGWDIQHLVRLFVTSEAYRRSGTITPEHLERDPENRFFARSHRTRLPAMLLRDQALAVAGLLRLDVGGHPVYPQQPEGLWEEFSFGKISYPHNEDPGQIYRRSLYTFWRRTSSPTNMFDSSARQVCTVKSSTTNTPLHALVLLNDITYVDAARGLARRMIEEGGHEVPDRLAYGFTLATGRPPQPKEAQLLENGFERSLNEFQSFPKEAAQYAAANIAETPENTVIRAATVRMAQVILNLDATLVRP